MDVISARIPKELKEEMKKININWSEELRKFVIKTITKQKREMAIKNLEKIRKKHKKSKITMSELVIRSRKEH